MSRSVAEFWSKFREQGDCLVWTGPTDRGGYGRDWVNGERGLTHRHAWKLRHGDISPGLDVLHTCDTPPCAADAHLFLGTDVENARDRKRKGRSATGRRNGRSTRPERTARGERHGKVKLRAVDVIEARRRHRSGEIGFAALAREFGVCTETIRKAVLGQSWRHL